MNGLALVQNTYLVLRQINVKPQLYAFKISINKLVSTGKLYTVKLPINSLMSHEQQKKLYYRKFC